MGPQNALTLFLGGRIFSACFVIRPPRLRSWRDGSLTMLWYRFAPHFAHSSKNAFR